MSCTTSLPMKNMLGYIKEEHLILNEGNIHGDIQMLSSRMIALVAFLVRRETQKDIAESIRAQLDPLILMEVNIDDTPKHFWRQSQHKTD